MENETDHQVKTINKSKIWKDIPQTRIVALSFGLEEAGEWEFSKKFPNAYGDEPEDDKEMQEAKLKSLQLDPSQSTMSSNQQNNQIQIQLDPQVGNNKTRTNDRSQTMRNLDSSNQEIASGIGQGNLGDPSQTSKIKTILASKGIRSKQDREFEKKKFFERCGAKLFDEAQSLHVNLK